MKKKQMFGMVLAVIFIVLGQIAPMFLEVENLSQTGMKTIGLLLAFLVMLITEALPVIVTSLIFCALMPLLRVSPNLGTALGGFSEPVVFFTLASFGIASAITNIPLSKRILRALLRAFGRNIERVLLAMMICCAVVSSIVSNVPTCAIFTVLALDFIKLYDSEEDRRRSGKVFMIGIPVASMIGGMMTPAGSSINLLAISQLELYTNHTISFVQWMTAGVPLCAVMIPLAWLVIVKVYKPAAASSDKISTFVENLDIPEKMGSKEIKVLVIIVTMLFFWISSSWVSSINVMIVAILGCCTLFLPGIDVLEIKTFIRDNSWDAFFLVGAVLSISSAMVSSGVSSFIATSIPTINAPTHVLIAFTAILIFLALIIIPVATSLIPVMAAPLVAIAAGAGVSPALIMLTASLCACNCYLLPLDTVTLITYSKGYYSMTDMAKSTVFLQLAMVILCVIWLPVFGMIYGLV